LSALIEGVRIRFDHVSIAVVSIDRAVSFFQRYFPTYPRHDKDVSEQTQGGFLWQDLYLGGVAVEFIEEMPGERGFISEFIRRYGQGLHHLAFETDRLDPIVAALKADGVRIVDEHEFPDGQKTAFISPRSAFGALIQLWQPLDYDNPGSRPIDDGRAHFDHVALAVTKIEPAMRFFERYFPAQVINYPVASSSQGSFILAHMDVAGIQLEFLQSSGPGTENDFVRSFIDRYGEGLHHFTVDVKDFEGILTKLRSDGIRIVGEETNWRGERQFYISPQSAFGTLIQVWDGLQGPSAGSE
jgi:methylmalonyl-CoA/ethylmalonyl-CoA epimerase